MKKSSLKIIGVGSYFGEDKVGFEVIKLLCSSEELKPYIPEKISLECCERSCFDLLPQMEGAKSVILIDAVKTDSKPGVVYRFNKRQIMQDGFKFPSALSSHSFGLGEVISLCDALGALPNDLRFYCIEIDDIQYQSPISDDVSMAMERLTKMIVEDVIRGQVWNEESLFCERDDTTMLL